MSLQYPFSAVLGCDVADDRPLEPMGLALILNAISPEIGGVLIRGEKGTAKSTTVRGLAAVLPELEVYAGDRFSIDPADPAASSPDVVAPGPVERRPVRLVELPVGATEDRVLGSLHLEKALTAGAVEFEPGMLARAHRGVLYVDEVNLLHDHLVDLLLDAAATGSVTIERDGVSLQHAARFLLIGTMNPEEGELRPQLLDRFGLTVEVAAPRDPALRVEVVRRRLAFDADPAGFCRGWASAQLGLTARIDQARVLVGRVVLGDGALLKIAEVCAAFEVDGLRADIVTARTAVAHAAWSGRTEVTRADIRAAALLALPHRRRRNPFDAPGIDEELLDQILGDDEPDGPGDGPEPDGTDGPESIDGTESTDAPANGDRPENADAPEQGDSQAEAPETDQGQAPEREGPETEAAEQAGENQAPTPGAPQPPTERAHAPYRPKLLTLDGVGEGNPGRRSRARGTNGRRVGVEPGVGAGRSLHLVETIRAAAERTALTGTSRSDRRLALTPADLRSASREGRESNLLLFCVDASGSMAARRRMAQVKTAVLSLLSDAYRRRDKVAMVSFRGQSARLVLPPTGSVEVAARLLDDLPAGGRTPVAEGLLEAAAVLRRERLRDPRQRPLLLLITDGRATAGNDAVARSQQAAAHLAALGVPAVVIDSEDGPMRLGLARRLAAHLGAEHLPMAEVSATALTAIAEERVA
ncbi:VWA domain-containing protein [Nocardioides sp. Bht2]|uniref:VWA domain-containing protein n=1 Tax=Nocardioides sp. Bht2 TaxID=3392297 RepID=UPI0039B4FE22